MKKLFNRLLISMIAVFAVTFLPCVANKNFEEHANALSSVTISLVEDVRDSSKTTTKTTNSEGKLDSLPELSHTASNLFAGWYTNFSADGVKITTDYVFEEPTTIYAKWISRTFNYTIENNGSNIKLTESAEDFSYVVGDNFDTMASVLEKIKQDNTEKKPVSLNFVNFTTTSQLNFSFSNLTISGTINTETSGTAITFTVTGDSNLTLENFSLTGTCEHYASFSTSGYSNKLIFTNCNFLATTTSDYGMTFSGGISTTFNTFFSHSSKYLLEYKASVSGSLTINKLSQGSKIVQSAPYTCDNVAVAFYLHATSIKYFQVLPTDDFYQIELSSSSTKATAYILCEFLPNEGEFKADYTAPTRINTNLNSFEFATSNDIQLLHNSFCGWAGKIEFSKTEITKYGLNGSTYYFDKNMLQSFVDDGSDLSKLASFFTTNQAELSSTALFSGFSQTDKSHIDIFCNLKKQATFIAQFKETIYSINFETNSETSLDSITGVYDSDVTIPTSLSKTGHSFAGWCTDSTLETPCMPITKMPDTNPTLYAKWTANSYNVILHHCDGTNNTTVIPTVFGHEIVLASVAYPGHEIDKSNNTTGYYLDAEFLSPLSQTTMPAQNLDIYIKWKNKTVTIYFESMSGQPLMQTSFTFGSQVTIPTPYDNPGYTFNGWFTDTTFTDPFDFETFPDRNCTAYAYWIANTYTITFNSDGGSQTDSLTTQFNQTITEPFTPIKKGFKFLGWFEDSASQKYTFNKMPNKSFSLTAKWLEKESIELSTGSQSYNVDSAICKYVVESKLDDFVVKYFVDGEWSNVAPSEIGTYDVSIFRAEDDTYKEVSYTIEKGLVIENRILNIAWVIVLVYFLFFAEIALVIFLRFLRGKKARDTIAFSLSLPIGIITTNQLVLLIVGAVLFVAGFVLMIYEFVKLHYTVPDLTASQSMTDNVVSASKRLDKSEDSAISKRVDDLLQKEMGIAQEFDANHEQEEQIDGQNEADDNENSDEEGIFLQDFDKDDK